MNERDIRVKINPNKKDNVKISPCEDIMTKIQAISWLSDQSNIFTIWPRFFHKIKSSYNRILTLCAFIKLGWNDYDWDYYYLLKILEFKLRRMHKSFLNGDALSVDCDKRAEEIKKALEACTRLANQEYESEAMKPLDEKWGVIKTRFKEADPDTKCIPVDFYRDGIKTPEDKAQEEKEFKEAFKKAERAEKADAKILFGTMEKYYKGWWD